MAARKGKNRRSPFLTDTSVSRQDAGIRRGMLKPVSVAAPKSKKKIAAPKPTEVKVPAPVPVAQSAGRPTPLSPRDFRRAVPPRPVKPKPLRERRHR